MSSAKRSATSELNHDNWDDEVEPEDAGKFSQADENTLKGRVIKKAKRRGKKIQKTMFFSHSKQLYRIHFLQNLQNFNSGKSSKNDVKRSKNRKNQQESQEKTYFSRSAKAKA